MPLFMDHHRGLTAEAVAEARKKDLEIQDEHGVKYHRYWFNEETGEVFCLAVKPEQGSGGGRPPRGACSGGGRVSGGQRRFLAPH
jgi:Protein of unknown function (DUF4242)